jgi:pimeloyl-ACP methyl ester carboxylesterase
VAYPERVPGRDAAHLVRAYARAPGFIAVNDAMRAARFTALDQIRCPVTLIWPEYDRLVERPAGLPSNVVSVALPDAGHVPMWDAPAALVTLIATAENAVTQPISPA